MSRHFYNAQDILRVLERHNSAPQLKPDWHTRYYPIYYRSKILPGARPAAGETDKGVLVGQVSKLLYHDRLEREPLFKNNFKEGAVVFSAAETTTLNAQLLSLARTMHEQKYFRGWRDETYAARPYDHTDRQTFLVERSFAKSLGLVRRSVHVNGLVVSTALPSNTLEEDKQRRTNKKESENDDAVKNKTSPGEEKKRRGEATTRSAGDSSSSTSREVTSPNTRVRSTTSGTAGTTNLLTWMGFRSATKSRFPSMYDQLAAGGIAYDETPLFAAMRECWEEASVPMRYAEENLVSGGVLTRVSEEDTGETKYPCYSAEEIFVFDLPVDCSRSEFYFPQPRDTEVERFETFSIEQVFEAYDRVKPDVLLVFADLLVRFGLINPDSPRYSELVRALHVPLMTHAAPIATASSSTTVTPPPPKEATVSTKEKRGKVKEREVISTKG